MAKEKIDWDLGIGSDGIVGNNEFRSERGTYSSKAPEQKGIVFNIGFAGQVNEEELKRAINHQGGVNLEN
ncbi:MAG: hypothetical protein K9M51_00680 [Candidatus Gracilibacteria bacterium]|nr:hypothetical protein [Candidatus Gracilibacteria bacterium]